MGQFEILADLADTRNQALRFVQNSLCCNMDMIIFDLHGYGGR